MIENLVKECRTFRRFDEIQRIPYETMVGMVDCARNTASSCNAQPLKYRIFSTPEECAALYPNVAWAGALKDWDGPAEGERPTGYIVILVDESLQVNDKCNAWDTGIVAQTMMLRAVEEGFGGCMMGSFRKGSVAELCATDLAPVLVLALGKPIEDVRIVDVPADGNIKYYRDQDMVHYVPKRSLEDVLLR